MLSGVFAARVMNYPPVAPGVRRDFSLCNFDTAYLETPFIFNTVAKE